MSRRIFLLPMLIALFFAGSLIASDARLELPHVSFDASYADGKLSITVDHAEGWHTYAFDNTALGGSSGDLSIQVSGGLKTTGNWSATPGSHFYASTNDNVYEEVVVFSIDVKQVSSDNAIIVFDGQICDEMGCEIIRPEESMISLGLPELKAPSASKSSFTGSVSAPEDDKNVTYTATITGDTLSILVSHKPTFHTYGFDNAEKGGMSGNTKITLSGGLELSGAFTPSREAHDIMSDEDKKLMDAKGDWAWGDEVTFTAELNWLSEAPSTLSIAGQVCDAMGCFPYMGDAALTISIPSMPSFSASSAAEANIDVEALKKDIKREVAESIKAAFKAEQERKAEKEAERLKAEAEQAEQDRLAEEEHQEALKLQAKKEADAKKAAAEKKAQEAQASEKSSASASVKSERSAEEIEKLRDQKRKERANKQKEESEESIWAFVLKCFLGGLLALIMPCVFPMIPITVSFFGKQAEASGKSTFGIALIYGLGLMLSYTGLGFLLSTFWSVAKFGNSPVTAIAVGVFFLVFAFSMFGMFELRLPHGIAQKFNMQGKSSGALGAFILGMTFAVTSMACTVPVVATIFASIKGGDWTRPVLGMVIYSAVVAAPFIILGAVPGLLSKMPRAGGWMNNVKVIFGFVELAAAFEFFGWARIVSREAVVAIWIGCSIASALYLLGVWRTKHDIKPEGIGASRLLFATAFIALVFWLFPALDGRPLSITTIESFLVPNDQRKDTSAQIDDVRGDLEGVQDSVFELGNVLSEMQVQLAQGSFQGTENIDNNGTESSANVGTPKGITRNQFTKIKNPNLRDALADAKKDGRPIFIDITGKN